MTETDPAITALMGTRQEGRNDEALRLLVDLFEKARDDARLFRRVHFMLMFEWSLLVPEYAPARQALARARDEQARRLLAGDDVVSAREEGGPHAGFSLIARMNEILGDERATHALFVEMLVTLPARARQAAHIALPAIVAAGDFALAEGYLRDPMSDLVRLNGMAAELPLFPAPGGPPREPPRLAIELLIFINDLRLKLAVLNGLGRDAQARSLRDAALAGIVSDEMRALGQRELDAPRTITGEIAARHDAPA